MVPGHSLVWVALNHNNYHRRHRSYLPCHTASNNQANQRCDVVIYAGGAHAMPTESNLHQVSVALLIQLLCRSATVAKRTNVQSRWKIPDRHPLLAELLLALEGYVNLYGVCLSCTADC